MERYLFEIVGGILIFLSSLVGEALPKRWKIYSYIAFALIAFAYVLIGIHLDKDTAKRDSDLQKSLREATGQLAGARGDVSNLSSAFARVMPMLGSLQGDLSSLRLQVFAGKEKHSPQEIAALQNKATAAAQAAAQIAQLFSEQNKRQSWPFGASGLPKYPHLHEWFITNFPAASALDGEERFVLYSLLKRGGKTSGNDVAQLQSDLRSEFGSFSNLYMTMEKLKHTDFVEKRQTPWDDIKLAEPYFSSFQHVAVP
jgi:hypothetical protein